jgi:hypothetical protein
MNQLFQLLMSIQTGSDIAEHELFFPKATPYLEELLYQE